MNKIFILNDMKIEGVENIPLLEIEYIKQNINLSNYDALIFTSKNAIYSLNSFNHDWKNIPSYAIANKTKNVILEEGGKVEFVGKFGNGNDFATELIDLLTNKKSLYVRAEKVASNLTNILRDNNICIDELITYKTACSKYNNKFKIPKNSIIIFSSPSTIDCFFKLFQWDSTYKAIAIGATTASYLPEDISCEISPSQSINDCINLAKKYI